MSSLFAKNVGSIDRIGRIVLGLALLTIALTGPKTPWGYLGIIPLFTAAIGSCPLYSLFGFDTCPAKR